MDPEFLFLEPEELAQKVWENQQLAEAFAALNEMLLDHYDLAAFLFPRKALPTNQQQKQALDSPLC